MFGLMLGVLAKLILLLLLLGASFSVDRGNFKTCKQSSFCDRQQQIKEQTLQHKIDFDSVRVNPYGLTAVISTNDINHTLSLKVTYQKFSVYHVLIDEITNDYKRYRVPIGDVVLNEVKPKPLQVFVDNNKAVLRGYSGDDAIVYFNPFFIEFFIDKVKVAAVNKRSLLNFEHQRVKPIRVVESTGESVSQDNNSAEMEFHSATEDTVRAEKAVPDSLEDNKEMKEIDQTHLTNSDENVNEVEKVTSDVDSPSNLPDQDPTWSESFKGHVDSRPHGLNSISLDVDFYGVDQVYGIPEHAGSLPLQSTTKDNPYRLFNLDVFEYELDAQMALYGSVPLLWGHSLNFTVGIFWLNPSETWVNVEHSNSPKSGIFSRIPTFFSKQHESIVNTRWISESGLVDSFIFLGHSPAEVMKAYAHLTGTTKLPPLFALGYHQCRWNYKDEADVLDIDKKFDENQIPVDVIWLDIEHTDGKRYFTWDSSKFPNPGEMVDKLNSKGRKLVTVVDPHIKRDTNWGIYRDAQSRDHFIKTRDGVEFDGWCWPGSSSWPDFTDPSVRRWWAEQFLTYQPLRKDSMFTWNDMGEPSVFNGPEVTVHKDVKHANNWENRDIHNLYGLYVHQATWEGLLLRSEGLERPFVLTRAFFAGSQRTSAVWTGDNAADWGHLKVSVPMILSLSIAGITFSGADVGGFFGNPDTELLTRWYQAGAYQPFFRAHAHMDTRRREPWLVPTENLDIIRSAIQARYSLLPYWYTMFARSEADGQPVMAPMWFHFPRDVNTFAIDEQYMIGEAVLVRPVTEQGVRSVQVYFPTGIWYSSSSFQVYEGDRSLDYHVTLSSIPVFYRGGWIVPRKERWRRSSWFMRYDPYTFYVFLDPKQTNATGYVYYDDFHSTSLKNAHFFLIIYEQIPDPTGEKMHGGRLHLKRLPLPGHDAILNEFSEDETIPQIERIVIVGLNSPIQRVTVIEHSKFSRRNVEFTITPISYVSGDQHIPQLVVIRQPRLSVEDKWELHLVTGKESKDDL